MKRKLRYRISHPLELDPDTVLQVQYKGAQTIDVAPVDNVLKEIRSELETPREPLSYSWSSPDTILAATILVGCILPVGVAFACFNLP